jgi:hypothetical protein
MIPTSQSYLRCRFRFISTILGTCIHVDLVILCVILGVGGDLLGIDTSGGARRRQCALRWAARVSGGRPVVRNVGDHAHEAHRLGVG